MSASSPSLLDASQPPPLLSSATSASPFEAHHLPPIASHALPPSPYHTASSGAMSLSSSFLVSPLLASQPPPPSPLFSPSASFMADDLSLPSLFSASVAFAAAAAPARPACCPSSSSQSPSSSSSSSSSSVACLSVSTVPRLLHPFFSSSDLFSHSGALFTVSDLLAVSSLNRCIAALARSERIWRPRLQAAIAVRYPAAARLSHDEETEEHKHPFHHQHHQLQRQQQQQQQQPEPVVRFTCPYLSAMRQNSIDKGGSGSLSHLISPNPFVSDLVQQLEASTAKDTQRRAVTIDAAQDMEVATASSPAMSVLSSISVQLSQSSSSSSTSSSPFLPSAAASSTFWASLSSKARYIALCQCSLHGIAGCARLVSPLPPLPAPSSQAHWAHTRVLHYPAPPSLNSCDSLPTLPLCAGCRASLAVCMKDYYDYRGEWAGQFTMTPLSIAVIRPPDLPAAATANERPVAVLDVRYSHIGGYDGVDHRRFEVEYIKAGRSGCTCGCGGLSAGASSVGEWSVRVMHRYRSGIYAMDSPLNVVSNDRLGYSHLRERERLAQRKRKTNVTTQPFNQQLTQTAAPAATVDANV